MLHFHTDSYPMTIERISCDAEIGSVKRGWHVCNRKAHFAKESRFGGELHYCTKHAPSGSRSLATPRQVEFVDALIVPL